MWNFGSPPPPPGFLKNDVNEFNAMSKETSEITTLIFVCGEMKIF